MKKFVGLLYSCFFTCAPLAGVILEAPHFKTVCDHLSDECLIVLDIDDTLLLPAQMLGCDEWFLYENKKYIKQGFTPSEAIEKVISEWEAVRHLTNVVVVEPGTAEIVKQWQQHYPVMGLTTQGIALATRTVQQLQSLEIDLTLSAPSKADHYFINRHGVLYRDGILFTSGTPKGKALIKLLELADVHPKKIIFLNDKATHLKDVESEVELNGMEFVGLRYSYPDAIKARFKPEIAEIQFHHSSFSHILTDEEATEWMKTRDN